MPPLKTKINHKCLKNISLFLDFSKRSEQQSNSILQNSTREYHRTQFTLYCMRILYVRFSNRSTILQLTLYLHAFTFKSK